MIYAGVDVAKANHVIGAVGDDGRPLCKSMEFKNSDAGFERCSAWLEGLAEEPSDVLVGMEATGHYWMALFARLAAEGYSVCVINPMEVKAVRKLKGKSRVKNDRVDALLIAETLRIGEYVETKLASDEVQSLRTLTRYRQAIKEEAAQVKIRLTCVMDSYLPEYAGVFSDMFGSASLAVLEKSPMPSELLRRKAPSLASDISKAARRQIGQAKASELKAAAKSSVGITLGLDAASFEVRSMVSQVRFLEERASEVEERIEELLMGIELLVLTIPGVSLAQTYRRRGGRREPLPQRRRARQLRGPELVGEPVRAVRLGGRPHNQARRPVPPAGGVAGGEPRPPARPGAQGLLRQEEGRGQAPPSRRHGGREEALPHRVRRRCAAPGPPSPASSP